MGEESKTTAKVRVYGDKDCNNCVETDNKFKEKLKNPTVDYAYIDVYSDDGQKKLADLGVKEGEHIDVPIVKIEKCEIIKDEHGAEQKKCEPERDFKDSDWSYIETEEKEAEEAK